MTALEQIESDMRRAAQWAERYRLRGYTSKAYRALGIAEGLRSAAAYIRAEADPKPPTEQPK